MTTAALAAGKHVWCEKPMAPNLPDAEKMLAAARASGKVAVLGYNYIQNPVIRHIGKLIAEGTIGPVNHVRIEMDEDFLADPEAPFQQRHEAVQRLWRDRRFRGASAVAGPDAVRRHRARDVRHGQALSDPQDAARASARSRSTTSPRS